MSPQEWLASQSKKTESSVPPSPEEWLASQGAKAETTAGGVAGAITRGVALPVAGAMAGAAMGAPVGGVGAIPGAIAGAGAATLAQMVGDPVVSAVNSMFGTQYTMPTDAMADLLTRVGVPQARTSAEKIIQTASTGASLGGGFAAAGKAMQTMAASRLASGVGAQMAAQPLSQVIGGGASGAAAQAVEQAGGGTAAQIAAGIAGGVAGAKAAKPSKPKVTQQIAPELAEAERAGVRVLTSDISPPKTFISKTMQAAGERIPIAGTGPVRQAQQAERIDAVKNLLTEYGAGDVSELSGAVMKDLSKRRSADLSKYSGLKRDVIERLSAAGEVPVPNTINAIDNEIERLQGLKTENVSNVISVLKDWKNSIQGQNISNVEELRKMVGESFKSPDLATIRGVGEKSLSSIYPQLREDMKNFIKANGDRRDFDKWMIANKRLSETADDLKNASLKSVLMKGDVTPEVVQNLLFSSKPSDIKTLYSKLSGEGRAAARAAILSKAAKDSSIDFAGETIVSPDKFANSVKKLGESVGVFFSGDDLQRVKGLTKVINITKRAGEAAAFPVTGAQNWLSGILGISAGAYGGGVTGALTSAAVLGGVGGMARVYESQAVRNLLLKMSKTKPGSADEMEIAKRLFATANVVNDSGQQENE